MTHVRMTDHLDAPIERVFELVTDFKRYPEWNVSYAEILDVTGPPVLGTKVRSVMKILGRRMEGTGEIVEIDPPRLIKLTGTGIEGGVLTILQRLTPVGTGTDIEAEIDYELPAGIIGQIANKLLVEGTVARDLRHSQENFKALVEAPQPVLA
jgi:uncharacterized protein YndB with AHSA1/START domain